MNEKMSGILIVDKKKDMTSHDVVDLIRRRFEIKKVGHAGTLDPNATGVLVILLGKATKLSNKFLNEDKEYEAEIKLGERTDSADCTGKIIAVRDVWVSEQQIKIVISNFVGKLEQVPPMVSAKRIKGERLYKLARRGIEVERKPREVVIKEIEIISSHIPFVSFRIVCSKGTYIRQLADDIGEKLDCGAHIRELRRIRSGSFLLKDSVPFADLLNMNREVFYENIIRV